MRKTTKLIKYIQKNVNKWKDIPCSSIGRLNTFKIISHQLDLQIYRYSKFPIKHKANYFVNIDKIIDGKSNAQGSQYSTPEKGQIQRTYTTQLHDLL